MGDGLRVSGGEGDVAADVDDLRRVADELDRSGDVLRDLADRARRLTHSGDLLASVPLSPGTAASAEAQLLDAAFGPRGLLPQALGVEGAARGLRAVATAFETRDAAVAGLLDAREQAFGWTAGRFAPQLLAAGTVIALTAGALHLAEEAWDQGAIVTVWDYASGRIDRASFDRRMQLLWEEARGDLETDAMAFGTDLLFSHPELTDLVVGGGPAFLDGLASRVGGEHFLEARGIDVPDTFEALTAAILAAGAGHGYWDDTRPIGVEEPVAIDDGTVPRDLADIFRGQGELYTNAAGDQASAIRVVHVTGPDGEDRFIVHIPGTEVWGRTSGPDLSDETTNLTLMGHHDAALLDAVAEAMSLAGVQPHDPVMLAGHSQGGIAAAVFAANEDHAAQFNITHVVTGGSPIGRIPVPAEVTVLSLEHEQDPVPRLDGDPNPDRHNHTTVVRDLDGVTDDPFVAHGSDHYRETGRLATASDDPSLVAWRESAAPFFTGDGHVTESTIRRNP